MIEREIKSRVATILKRSTLAPEIAEDVARSYVLLQRALDEALGPGGSAGRAKDLAAAVKSTGEYLGIDAKQKAATDPDRIVFIQAIARSTAEDRFYLAHAEEDQRMWALCLRYLDYHQHNPLSDEEHTDLWQRVQALYDVYNREMPDLFAMEVRRVCNERGLDLDPEWQRYPDEWKLPPVGQASPT